MITVLSQLGITLENCIFHLGLLRTKSLCNLSHKLHHFLRSQFEKTTLACFTIFGVVPIYVIIQIEYSEKNLNFGLEENLDCLVHKTLKDVKVSQLGAL